MLHVLASAGTFVVPASTAPADAVQAMRDLDVTHASATPTFWRMALSVLDETTAAAAQAPADHPRRRGLARAAARAAAAALPERLDLARLRGHRVRLGAVGARRQARSAAVPARPGRRCRRALPDRRRRAPGQLVGRHARVLRRTRLRRRLATDRRPGRGRGRPHPVQGQDQRHHQRRRREGASSPRRGADHRRTRCRAWHGSTAATTRSPVRSSPSTSSPVDGADTAQIDRDIREAPAGLGPAARPRRIRFVERARAARRQAGAHAMTRTVIVTGGSRGLGLGHRAGLPRRRRPGRCVQPQRDAGHRCLGCRPA